MSIIEMANPQCPTLNSAVFVNRASNPVKDIVSVFLLLSHQLRKCVNNASVQRVSCLR